LKLELHAEPTPHKKWPPQRLKDSTNTLWILLPNMRVCTFTHLLEPRAELAPHEQRPIALGQLAVPMHQQRGRALLHGADL